MFVSFALGVHGKVLIYPFVTDCDSVQMYHNIELERDKLVDLNNLDFALRSDSTAC